MVISFKFNNDNGEITCIKIDSNVAIQNDSHIIGFYGRNHWVQKNDDPYSLYLVDLELYCESLSHSWVVATLLKSKEWKIFKRKQKLERVLDVV